MSGARASGPVSRAEELAAVRQIRPDVGAFVCASVVVLDAPPFVDDEILGHLGFGILVRLIAHWAAVAPHPHARGPSQG
jgi:hypothetical protein